MKKSLYLLSALLVISGCSMITRDPNLDLMNPGNNTGNIISGIEIDQINTGALTTGLLLTGSTSLTGEVAACTLDYTPVCAKVQVQCIKAPCPPVEQTFSNKCEMDANKLAEFAYTGECKDNNTLLSGEKQ